MPEAVDDPDPLRAADAELGDMAPAEFRKAAHEMADMLADYFEGVSKYPVVPKIVPGEFRAKLPAQPPEESESLTNIFSDYKNLIEPNVTHWNHPGFLAYFAITGSGPGILGEALAAGLNVNAMLWKTGPAPTELEELTCDWLRQMIGLPASFWGHINDTASMSTLLSLAAARHRLPGLNVREKGLGGRSDIPRLTLYCSDQAHSSVDKAAMALGFGLENVRKVRSDAAWRMDTAALKEIIVADRKAGMCPTAVVATAGTTSSTSVDPLQEIAAVCRDEDLWFHVDAAYAGSAAVCPEFRKLLRGWEDADSVVVNPHKWLFTPVDCSVLFVKDRALLKDTFSLVPEYLRTDDAGATNLMDYGVQLGRRFRSLKLWMVIRAFGVEGIRARIRQHCAWANEFESWVRAESGFEVCAPRPFSTVCFRATSDLPEINLNELNENILQQVNRDGSVFMSSTKLSDKFVLRMTIGNLRTTRADVAEAWRLIRAAKARL